MLFTKPIPFTEAIKSNQLKALLPTTLTSEQIAQLTPDIRRASFFSARVANTDFLQELKDKIGAILTPKMDERGVNVGLNIPYARSQLRDFLTRISYQPEAGTAGTIQDLTTDQRLNLILQTQLDMAHGYGAWSEGQDEAILDAYPAQEFYRAEDRIEPRDWPERWSAAGGEFFEGASDYPDGRMIALKNDPIWTEISEFDLPYAPFDYNSGMDIRDVDRVEAQDLGLLTIDDVIDPEERNFGEDLKASVATFDPELIGNLLETLGDSYEVVKGVLQLK